MTPPRSSCCRPVRPRQEPAGRRPRLAPAGWQRRDRGPARRRAGFAAWPPRRTGLPDERARYLARHPQAALYADFGDFAFYRMRIERAHLIGGFGRIHWLDGAAVLVAPQPALAEAEPEIVAHMNQDHRDVVQLYARELLGLAGADWALTGIDPEGCDLRMGGRTGRLEFEAPVGAPETARAALVGLARRAREHLGKS